MDQVIATNLRPAFLNARYFQPLLVKAGRQQL
jgi:NAD(P)-dependent dehydrogenase (short-subunit alcohol dehydrogenase family)